MNIQALAKNMLIATSWLPGGTENYVTNPAGNEGYLNLAWAIAGKPTKIPKTFCTDPATCAIWFMATQVGLRYLGDVQIREHLTLMSQKEFLNLVEANPDVFVVYMPMDTWRKVLK